MPRKGYPTEFRRRALDLVVSGRKIVDVARDLGISDQTVYTWRRRSGSTEVKSQGSPPANGPSWWRPSARSRPSKPSLPFTGGPPSC